MTIEKNIKENFDLTFFNTFRLGAKARYFLMVKNQEDFIRALNWAKARKIKIFILAGGSNILIVKDLINGLVIKIAGEQYEFSKNFMTGWAGNGLTKMAKLAAEHKLSGLEWAMGIPGSLGGAVRGNAGAYGSDISGQVVWVEAIDLNSGRLMRLNKASCAFSYRHSVFKENMNWLILNVKLKLAKRQPDEIIDLSKKNIFHRHQTKPKEPSAGCIFKNLEYDILFKQNHDLALSIKSQGFLKGNKLGAGFLIDRAGFRGKSVGGAKVSDKHANFIVNTGQARAKDVVKLINSIKKKVKKIYKINLQEEIVYYGN
jgi:UDP-N-acetylmuramate dehydrogenase